MRARKAVEDAIAAEREIALDLRDSGHSWSAIGAAVGLSGEGARSRYGTVTINGVRQRISVEAPLPGASVREYASDWGVPLRRVREMIETGELRSVSVPYRGRTVTRIVR